MPTANEERYAERRGQYLSANKTGLKKTVAEAVAWSELGYTKSGIATVMDVADTTAKSYLRAAADAYPGILKRSADDISWQPEADLRDLPSSADRECPVCLNDNLCSPREAEAVFRVGTWGATEMLEDADRVCSVCLSVRRDGSWERMKTIDSRAYELSQGSSTKNSDDYREVITGGIEPSGRAGDDPAPAVDDEESEDMDW